MQLCPFLRSHFLSNFPSLSSLRRMKYNPSYFTHTVNVKKTRLRDKKRGLEISRSLQLEKHRGGGGNTSPDHSARRSFPAGIKNCQFSEEHTRSDDFSRAQVDRDREREKNEQSYLRARGNEFPKLSPPTATVVVAFGYLFGTDIFHRA